ncbi:hypothetical protein [Amycolatopsis sp. cmx-11-32]|uniref:hypothetical protein n=1 Tax=Amycolatopsis sp. cmx-11-32 TaxID=2785796 RepID=UPI0039E2FA37
MPFAKFYGWTGNGQPAHRPFQNPGEATAGYARTRSSRRCQIVLKSRGPSEALQRIAVC